MTPLLDKAVAAPHALTHRELVGLLAYPDAEALFAAAYDVKCREIGPLKATSAKGGIFVETRFAGHRRDHSLEQTRRLAALGEAVSDVPLSLTPSVKKVYNLP